MALRLEKFDGTKTYMFVNGSVATPAEIRKHFPAVDSFPHVLELNGDVVQAVMNLSALRGIHKIDSGRTEAEAISDIETKINTPAPEPLPDGTERLAAAQEFANLSILPDTTPITTEKAVEIDPYAKLVKRNFDRGLWSKQMLDVAVNKGVITTTQKSAIMGESEIK